MYRNEYLEDDVDLRTYLANVKNILPEILKIGFQVNSLEKIYVQ